MKTFITRAPLLLGLGVLMTASFVFAQVVPEEFVSSVMEEVDDVVEIVVEPESSATTTEAVGLMSETSLSDEGVTSTSSERVLVEERAEGTSVLEEQSNESFFEDVEPPEEVVPSSPGACHEEGVQSRFRDIGECMRSVN